MDIYTSLASCGKIIWLKRVKYAALVNAGGNTTEGIYDKSIDI